VDILENAEVKLSAVSGETGKKVYRMFKAVLKRNKLLWQYAKSSTEKMLTLLRTSLLENFIC
jgi:hypothetical protein